jgi:hypothetical protein
MWYVVTHEEVSMQALAGLYVVRCPTCQEVQASEDGLTLTCSIPKTRSRLMMATGYT